MLYTKYIKLYTKYIREELTPIVIPDSIWNLSIRLSNIALGIPDQVWDDDKRVNMTAEVSSLG